MVMTRYTKCRVHKARQCKYSEKVSKGQRSIPMAQFTVTWQQINKYCPGKVDLN